MSAFRGIGSFIVFGAGVGLAFGAVNWIFGGRRQQVVVHTRPQPPPQQQPQHHYQQQPAGSGAGKIQFSDPCALPLKNLQDCLRMGTTVSCDKYRSMLEDCETRSMK